jgi:hypothetical protein
VALRRSSPTGGAPRRSRARVTLGWAGLGLLAIALLIQVLPIGQPRTNPPVIQDASWPDERTRGLAVGACYDCHSNQTRWPAYSYVAPVKWLVIRDVTEGRDKLNFSDWGEDADEAEDAAETIAEGSMPPRRYQLPHSGARLTDEERQALIDALTQMAADPGGG